MNTTPLVSLCVITYNSADFVLETLESAYNQTYKNIELIVSDDCSSDTTVEICQQWIDAHKDRFVHTEIVVAPHNMGTSANYNRAVDHSKGEWIKTIDGDDILLPNCVEDNLKFISENNEARFVFSDFVVFSDINGKRIEKESHYQERTSTFFKFGAEDQLKSLLLRNILPSPSSFLHGDTTRKYRFNERYKYIEDSPMWIKMTSEGFKMYSFDKKTVMYRHQESVSKSSQRFYSPLFLESDIILFWSERVHLIKKYNLKDAYLHHRRYFFMCELDDILFKNKKSTLNKVLHRLLLWIVSHFVTFKMN